MHRHGVLCITSCITAHYGCTCISVIFTRTGLFMQNITISEHKHFTKCKQNNKICIQIVLPCRHGKLPPVSHHIPYTFWLYIWSIQNLQCTPPLLFTGKIAQNTAHQEFGVMRRHYRLRAESPMSAQHHGNAMETGA